MKPASMLVCTQYYVRKAGVSWYPFNGSDEKKNLSNNYAMKELNSSYLRRPHLGLSGKILVNKMHFTVF